MEVHPFFCFPFGTVLYSIRSKRVGNVKSILGRRNVSIVISNSFGEINVLGMVAILTCGCWYVLYGAGVNAAAGGMRGRMRMICRSHPQLGESSGLFEW